METGSVTPAPHRDVPRAAVLVSFWPKCSLLAGVVGLVSAVAAPWAYHRHGWEGVWAVTISAAVCLAGSSAALAMAAALRGPNRALYSLLGGMFLRMGLPLVLALLFQHQGGALAQAGMVYDLLLFYLVTLVFETGLALSLPQEEPADRSPAAA